MTAPKDTSKITGLPDAAQAIVPLANKRNVLNDFEKVLVPGYTKSGNQITQELCALMQRPIFLKKCWLPIIFAQPFWPVAKHLSEMWYLWGSPHSLSGKEFVHLLPEFGQKLLKMLTDLHE